MQGYRIFVYTALGVAFALFVSATFAHNKVVVIPLGGEDAKVSQFRIVVTKEPAIAGEGRLEYTADPKPSGKSLWGKVCDDCFEGDNACDPAPPPTDKAAHLVCRDLGFVTGLVDTSDASANDGLNFFSLDDFKCPAAASSISGCTSTVVEDCRAGEEVYIQCLTSVPEIVFPGFSWSCSGLVGTLPSFPAEWNDLDDSDVRNPVFVGSNSAEGEFRQVYNDTIVALEMLIADNSPVYEVGLSASFVCPGGFPSASDSSSFDITSTTGRIWTVTFSYNLTSTEASFGDLVFRLKL